MADTKISALTAVGTLAGGDEFAIHDVSAGASRKVTATEIAALAPVEPDASDTAKGIIEIAIQSEMETGTDVVRAVTPGRQHFHPSAAKVWCEWTGNSTTILASYNMTSIADTAVGDADGTIATDFSSATWAKFISTQDATANGWDANSIQSSGFNAQDAGTFGALCGVIVDGGTAAANLIDPEQWNVVGFGDFA